MTVSVPTADSRPARQAARAITDGASGTETGPARRPATPAATTGRRLSPRVRKWLVAAHTLVGVGWFGIAAAKLIIEIVAASATDRTVTAAGFTFMAVLDRAVFPPAALATLITGIILSVGTAWGLFQHWWIVVKLALTVGVIVTGVVFVGAWTEQGALLAAQSAGDAAAALALHSTSRWLIGAAWAHVLMLAAATVISVLKPWGRLPRWS